MKVKVVVVVVVVVVVLVVVVVVVVVEVKVKVEARKLWEFLGSFGRPGPSESSCHYNGGHTEQEEKWDSTGSINRGPR